MLLHHRDLHGLLQVCSRIHDQNPSLTLVQEDEEETMRVLAESGVAERVNIDENGGKSLTSRMVNLSSIRVCSWATGKPWDD